MEISMELGRTDLKVGHQKQERAKNLNLQKSSAVKVKKSEVDNHFILFRKIIDFYLL